MGSICDTPSKNKTIKQPLPPPAPPQKKKGKKERTLCVELNCLNFGDPARSLKNKELICK